MHLVSLELLMAFDQNLADFREFSVIESLELLLVLNHADSVIESFEVALDEHLREFSVIASFVVALGSS